MEKKDVVYNESYVNGLLLKIESLELIHSAYSFLLEKFPQVNSQKEMDDFVSTACQEDAIGFGEWLLLNCNSTGQNIWYYIPNHYYHTTAQLYAIYLTDKNKEGV